MFHNAAAAVAAYILRRPVRLILDRDEDMHYTGHRHAFLGTYKVGTHSVLSLHSCWMFVRLLLSVQLSADTLQGLMQFLQSVYMK